VATRFRTAATTTSARERNELTAFFREARLRSMFEMEKRLQTYRANRDLPEKAADWLLLGESGGK
jgi:hypothetical protein